MAKLSIYIEFDGFFECLKSIFFEHDLYNVI